MGNAATDNDRFIEALQAVVDSERVRTSDLEMGIYGRDGSVLSGKPGVAVLVESVDEVQGCIRACIDHDRTFVVRGSGTGLAGGAVPVEESLLIVTTRMNRILEVDPLERVAWVEPGVLNLDLSRATEQYGLHFAPDPSSQQSCSIGGNVANNSGGPHCLAYGVTSAHVLALEVVLPDGEIAMFGDVVPEVDAGYDLRGVMVGSEGTMGVVTRAAVRLTQNPPDVTTMLFGFGSIADGAGMVSAIIAAGIIPAAIEMMDRNAIQVVEDFVHAGLPLDAEAILLVEIDGLTSGTRNDAERIRELAQANNATSERTAADNQERDLLWKGRKAAFGAVARLAPDYYLHDTVVPRKSLVEVLEKVNAVAERYELIIVNVFHAGDGNLHPILAFDGSDATSRDRAHQAGAEIVQISLDAGGSLSGEHGIGLEKRDYMSLMFSETDLGAQELIRCVFDPQMRANPNKVLPSGSRCGELISHNAASGDAMWI